MSRHKHTQITEVIELEKLVPGGQAIGRLANGKKTFIWGGLPGETAEIQTTKNKSSLVEGIATNIIKPSPNRVPPQDPDSYLSTSPWQIMNDHYEAEQKINLVRESFRQQKIDCGAGVFSQIISERCNSHNSHGRFQVPGAERLGSETATAECCDNYNIQRGAMRENIPAPQTYHYRNKMEYSFYGDETGLHFAFYARGTHHKIPIEHESLSMPALSKLAQQVLESLQSIGAQARDLKTLIVRATQNEQAAAQLYVKNHEFPVGELPGALPLQVFYSDPKCPASVQSELLVGTPLELTDTILGHTFSYGVDSFFQINLPVYEKTLAEIAKHIHTEKVLDLYSGVGAIGLSVAPNKELTLVEVNGNAVREMQKNAAGFKNSKIKTVHTEAEKALEYITPDSTIIVDPPRAGLHKDLTAKLLEIHPPTIIYLSCNPATQARDVQLLLAKYKITAMQTFNFFPKTPHIENLVVLERI